MKEHANRVKTKDFTPSKEVRTGQFQKKKGLMAGNGF